MPKIEGKYDQDKIDSLRRYLQRESEKGRARDYEIIVDGFKVVSRTDDIEEFDDYEQEIQDSTRNVTILIYDGDTTPRNTKYSFSLNQDNSFPQQPTNGLGSLGEVNQLIQQKLDEQNKEYQLERLREKLKETEEKLQEAEEYKDQLAQEIEHLNANKNSFQGINLGELGSEILKYTLARNAGKSPLAANLSGFLGAFGASPAPVPPETQEQEYEATMEAQEQPTEQQMAILRSIQQMEKVFSRQQLQVMTKVITTLMEHPDHLFPVAELLNINIKTDQ